MASQSHHRSARNRCCRGELLSLQWADTHFSRGQIHIRAEKAKSGKLREIPISPRLMAVLNLLKLDPTGEKRKPTDYVFGNAIGERITSPKKSWETAVLKAHGHDPKWLKGNKLSADCRAHLRAIDLHFHDLRHEAGSRLLECGWALHHVQAMLGHSDAKTTSIYLNVTTHQLIEAMRRSHGPTLLHRVAHEGATEPVPSVQQQSPSNADVLVN